MMAYTLSRKGSSLKSASGVVKTQREKDVYWPMATRKAEDMEFWSAMAATEKFQMGSPDGCRSGAPAS